MIESRDDGRPLLLVSVRNADEARAAVRGGADIVDVKEPSQGPLGRADPTTISKIVEVGRASGRPVTVALGELFEWFEDDAVAQAASNDGRWWAEPTLLKVGLAGMRGEDWPTRLRTLMETLDVPHDRWVPVAYADHDVARSPLPEDVIDVCATLGTRGVLFDTFDKSAGRLLDHLPIERLADLVDRLRANGRLAALAGRLRADDLPMLARIGPDVLGVRSAACVDGNRNGVIDADRVRELQRSIAGAGERLSCVPASGAIGGGK